MVTFEVLLALLVPVEGGELLGESKAVGACSIPASGWDFFTKRAINSPELKKFCFCHGFLVILLLLLVAK